MTRIMVGHRVFVHASDIQLLDDPTVDQVIDWRPDILLAAGPPLYLDRLTNAERDRAWESASPDSESRVLKRSRDGFRPECFKAGLP